MKLGYYKRTIMKLSRHLLLTTLFAARMAAADSISNASPEKVADLTPTNTTTVSLSLPPDWPKRWGVTEISGHVGTYSSPRKDTHCLLEVHELLNTNCPNMIKFMDNKGTNKMTELGLDWYVPCKGPFRAARVEKDLTGKVVALKLVAEQHEMSSSMRWTLSLDRISGYGFLILERDDIVEAVISLSLWSNKAR